MYLHSDINYTVELNLTQTLYYFFLNFYKLSNSKNKKNKFLIVPTSINS